MPPDDPSDLEPDDLPGLDEADSSELVEADLPGLDDDSPSPGEAGAPPEKPEPPEQAEGDPLDQVDKATKEWKEELDAAKAREAAVEEARDDARRQLDEVDSDLHDLAPQSQKGKELVDEAHGAIDEARAAIRKADDLESFKLVEDAINWARHELDAAAVDIPKKKKKKKKPPVYFVVGGFGLIGLVLTVGFCRTGVSDIPGDEAAVGPPAVTVEDEPQTAVEDEPAVAPEDELAQDAPGTEIAPPDYTTYEVTRDVAMQSWLGISLFDNDFILNDPTLLDLFGLSAVDPLLRTSFFEDGIDEDFGNLGPVPEFTGVAYWWAPLLEPIENPQVVWLDDYKNKADIVFPPGSLNTPAQNVLAVAVEIAADLTDPAVCAGKELVLVLNIYNPQWGEPYVANPRFPGEYYAGGNFFPNFNLNDCVPTSYADTYLNGEIISGLANSGVALFTVNDGVTRGVILLSEETVNADGSLRTILFEHPVGETFFAENTRYQSVPDIFDPAVLISDGITTAQYDFTLVAVEPDPQATAEDQSQASPTIDLGAQVEAFVAEFAAAATSDDIDFLVARLHPLSIQASDQQTCAVFVSREIAALDEYRATGPAQQVVFEFVINDQAVTVDPAFEIPVVFTFGGQEFTDNARFATVDGVMHYFATCR